MPLANTYQWSLDGVPILGATASTYSIPVATATNAGSYTVIVSNAKGSATSIGAILTVSGPPIAYLSNLSVLARAGAGSETLTFGVIVGGGAGTKSVLGRGSGPTLGTFGVSGALADPTLTLSVFQGALLNTNDDWGNDPDIADPSAAVGAFALPVSSRDAAINGAGFSTGASRAKT